MRPLRALAPPCDALATSTALAPSNVSRTPYTPSTTP